VDHRKRRRSPSDLGAEARRERDETHNVSQRFGEMLSRLG
jgi:hypothetical protein